MRRSGRSRPSVKPHRAAQPSVVVAFRRPRPLDQAAEHDAVAFGQARFERAEDAHAASPGCGAPAHDTAGKRRRKQFDIIGFLDEKTRGGLAGCEFVECVGKLLAVGAGQGCLGAAVARQCGENVAMARGKFAERMSFLAEVFERRRSALASRVDQVPRRRQVRARSDPCADRKDADRRLCGFCARENSSARAQAAAARTRPRAAQDRALERGDGVLCSPSRSSGCLSKASSVTGGAPSSAAAAASRAKIPAGVSASASPPESSAAMFQRAARRARGGRARDPA